MEIRNTVLLLIVAMTSGCASMSNRTKTLILMGGTGLAGGGIGAMGAPNGENQAAHGLLWGGVVAATAGAVGLFVFDEEAHRKEIQARVIRLEKELAAYSVEAVPELLGTNQMSVSKALPEKFRHLITPGQWSLYKVDRWASSSDNELVHQDLIFRFHQPQLNPNRKPSETNEKGGLEQ